MAWAAIIQLVLRAVVSLSDFLKEKRLLDAGSAVAINEGLKQTLANMEKSNAAANEIRNNPDGDFAKRVREKYTRDDK